MVKSIEAHQIYFNPWVHERKRKKKNGKEKGDDCSLKRPNARVNFMCQLEQAMRTPDIGSNIILGMPGRVFLVKVNIRIGGLNKAYCLS